MLDRPHIEGQ